MYIIAVNQHRIWVLAVHHHYDWFQPWSQPIVGSLLWASFSTCLRCFRTTRLTSLIYNCPINRVNPTEKVWQVMLWALKEVAGNLFFLVPSADFACFRGCFCVVKQHSTDFDDNDFLEFIIDLATSINVNIKHFLVSLILQREKSIKANKNINLWTIQRTVIFPLSCNASQKNLS